MKKLRNFFLTFFSTLLSVLVIAIGLVSYYHYLDKGHERELLLNLKTDLQADIQDIKEVTEFDSVRVLLLDQLLVLKRENLKKPEVARRFYDLVYFCFSGTKHFLPHTGSFALLKSNKGYSIIRNKALIDSLLKYETSTLYIHEQEALAKQTIQKVYLLKYELMDETIYDHPGQFDKNLGTWKPGSRPWVNTEHGLMNTFFNSVRDYKKETRYYYDNLLKNHGQLATVIIKMIDAEIQP